MSNNLEHYKKLRDPNYFGAYELISGEDTTGNLIRSEITLEIIKVVREKTKTKGETMEMVVYFSNHKPLICNAINSKNIAKATGTPIYENWKGKKITLYTENIKAFGEWQDVVRVRPNPPVISLPELMPTNPRWSGARIAILAKNTTIQAIREKFILTPENEALLCSPEQ